VQKYAQKPPSKNCSVSRALNVMANLRKTTESNIIGGREYWDLDNGLELIITVKDDPCFISLSGKNETFIRMLSAYLEAQEIDHSLTSTIDSWFFELPLTEKSKTIEAIEGWAW